jgi:hypothetical protein
MHKNIGKICIFAALIDQPQLNRGQDGRDAKEVVTFLNICQGEESTRFSVEQPHVHYLHNVVINAVKYKGLYRKLTFCIGMS